MTANAVVSWCNIINDWYSTQYSVVVVTLPYAKSCVAWPVHIHPFCLLSSKWRCQSGKKHICKINTCKTGYCYCVCICILFVTRGIHSRTSIITTRVLLQTFDCQRGIQHCSPGFFSSSIFEGWLNHIKNPYCSLTKALNIYIYIYICIYVIPIPQHVALNHV